MKNKATYSYNRKYPSIADLKQRAKKRIPKFAFDYLEGGAMKNTMCVLTKRIFSKFN